MPLVALGLAIILVVGENVTYVNAKAVILQESSLLLLPWLPEIM